MSWQSSALYYALLNQGVEAARGGFHSADCLLSSVDFATVERLQTEGRWEELSVLLGARARGLELAGAKILLLCSNTAHRVFDAVVEAVSIPLIHIVDASGQAVRAENLSRVGLIGTRFTMNDPHYLERWHANGLSVVLPSERDQAVVDAVIFDELVLGVVREASMENLREIGRGLVERGAEGVILACTELDALLSSPQSEFPMFSTARAHVSAVLARAIASDCSTAQVDLAQTRR